MRLVDTLADLRLRIAVAENAPLTWSLRRLRCGSRTWLEVHYVVHLRGSIPPVHKVVRTAYPTGTADDDLRWEGSVLALMLSSARADGFKARGFPKLPPDLLPVVDKNPTPRKDE